jgi:hypothetical protein
MDYHVFLLSRIRERYAQTGDTNEAVVHGIASTGRIITGAALIIVVVFAGFAAGQLVMFQQMGFGVAVALLVDATLIRMVVVPAAMVLLGRWNWYLPTWLNWLPELHVEGPGRHPTHPSRTATRLGECLTTTNPSATKASSGQNPSRIQTPFLGASPPPVGLRCSLAALRLLGESWLSTRQVRSRWLRRTCRSTPIASASEPSRLRGRSRSPRSREPRADPLLWPSRAPGWRDDLGPRPSSAGRCAVHPAPTIAKQMAGRGKRAMCPSQGHDADVGSLGYSGTVHSLRHSLRATRCEKRAAWVRGETLRVQRTFKADVRSFRPRR